MKKNKPWLYIPIETKVRELYGKTLLTSFAATSGFNVIIGSKQDINFKSTFLPKGTVFNIGLAKKMAENSRIFKRHGHKVAAIDEEGIVTLSDDLYVRHRISKEALSVTDMFFCWGKRQANLIEKKAKEAGCKIFIAGNPRFDMLRPEYRVIFDKDAKEIKKKYGKFILVNTNFGHGNHFAGDDFLIKSLKEKGWMDDPTDKEFFIANIGWQKKMFAEFQEMIPELSNNFKNYAIIIRPHPSENQDVWKGFEKTFPNVFVVHSGNVIPWLMAAEALIHNGCTTAVEAFILGKKVLSYRPFIIEEQETELPNKISMEVHSAEELIDTLDKAISDRILDDDISKKSYLNLYLAGVSGRTASENIVSSLSTGVESIPSGINYPLFLYFETRAYAGRIIQKILSRNISISESYRLHKMSSLTKSEIVDIIRDLSKINEKFKSLSVRRIGKTCYHVYENK